MLAQPIQTNVRFSAIPWLTRRQKIESRPEEATFRAIVSVAKEQPPLTAPNDYVIHKSVDAAHLVYRKIFNMNEIHMPPADEIEKLQSAANSKNATFVAVPHGEMFTDVLSMELMRGAHFPKALVWVSNGFFNPVFKPILRANNCIHNKSGEEGKQLSLKNAIAGNGVVIFPEGRVSWTGRKLQRFFNGIAELPIRTARQLKHDFRPVYVVPIVWKYRFLGNVSKELPKDIRYIEKKLELPPSSEELSLGERFYELQKNILEKQMSGFKLPSRIKNQAITPQNFFEVQQDYQEHLITVLETKYSSAKGTMVYRARKAMEKIKANLKQEQNTQSAYQKVKDWCLNTPPVPSRYQHDLKMALEVERLSGFTQEFYKEQTLTQEEISESLKRIIDDMHDYMNVSVPYLRWFLPVPVAPRAVHYRIADPIDVKNHMSQSGVSFSSETEDKEYQQKLLDDIHSRMQGKLDQLNDDLEPLVGQHRVDNPFQITIAKSKSA